MTPHPPAPLRPVSDEHRHEPADYELEPKELAAEAIKRVWQEYNLPVGPTMFRKMADEALTALTQAPRSCCAEERERTPASGEAGEMVERMTQRFLQWKLPEGFSPDAGISFNPEFNAEWNAKHGNPPQRHEPVGTNLFSHEQAKAMVQHMIEGTRLSTFTEAMRTLREVRTDLSAIESYPCHSRLDDAENIDMMQQRARTAVARIDKLFAAAVGQRLTCKELIA